MTNFLLLMLYGLNGYHRHLVIGQSTTINDRQVQSDQNVNCGLDHVMRSLTKLGANIDRQHDQTSQFIAQLLDAVDRQQHRIDALNQTLANFLHQTKPGIDHSAV
jgi:ABC-type transporter Mla subunit MlaD